ARLHFLIVKQNTTYDTGLGIPAEPLFRSRRSSLVCRWSTILIAGASAPYLRINDVYYSNWCRAYAALPFLSGHLCGSVWSSYSDLIYFGYRWRLLRHGRSWRSPSFSIASWPCYCLYCRHFYFLCPSSSRLWLTVD